MYGLYVALAAAVLSLLLAALFLMKNRSIPVLDARITEISGFIRNGAMAFLRREYSVVAIFVAALAVIFLLLPSMG